MPTPDDRASERPRDVLIEVGLLWLITMLLIRGLRLTVDVLGAPSVVLALVPLLFMYAPVLVCRWRGVDSWDYPLAIPSLRDWPVWRRALLLNLGLIAVMLGPWIALYHFWQTTWLPGLVTWANPMLYDALGFSIPVPHFSYRGVWPESFGLLVAYHLFFVAIPEEMFYRGYLQTRLQELWPPQTRAFGTLVGRGLVVSSLLFAFGHSIVELQWWHFAIFIPSLAFGWLRNNTGDIIAGAFFHAWCNVLAVTLDTLYGVVLPTSATSGG